MNKLFSSHIIPFTIQLAEVLSSVRPKSEMTSCGACLKLYSLDLISGFQVTLTVNIKFLPCLANKGPKSTAAEFSLVFAEKIDSLNKF